MKHKHNLYLSMVAISLQFAGLVWTGRAHAVAVDAIADGGYTDSEIVDAWIGTATVSGSARPVVCWFGGGVEVYALLNSSGSSLDSASSITMNNHSNYVYYQQTSTGDPGTDMDCGLTGWTTLSFNGYTLSVITESGPGWTPDNYVNGPNSSGNNWVSGANSVEYVVIHGSTMTTSLSGGVDYLFGAATHSSGSLLLGGGNDCIQLSGASSGGSVSCDSGTDRHNLSSPPASCETYQADPNCDLF